MPRPTFLRFDLLSAATKWLAAVVLVPFGLLLATMQMGRASRLPSEAAGAASSADPSASFLGLAADAPTLLCKAAITAAEAEVHIPDLFLAAIGKVESGRSLGAGGRVTPWPWTVDAEGAGHFYPTKAAAIEATRDLQARGVRSIDVGCLQVNLLQHPEAFTSLDQAFDPHANANFAAQLLASLFQQVGSWPLAAAAYHSQTPSLGAPYQQRVLAAWATPEAAVTPKPRNLVKTNPASASADAKPMATAIAVGRPMVTFNRELRLPPSAQASPSSALGRGLDVYRSHPIMLAWRVPRR